MRTFRSALLLIAIFAPCSAQRLKLSLNLAKGNTYYIVGTSNTIVVQIVNGQQTNIKSGLSYKMAFKVVSIIDSVYNMEVSYQYLNMKIKSANAAIELDSKKNDPADIPSTIIAAMMNKPFNIVLSRSGKIRSIKNIDQMIKGAFDNFTQIDAAKKQQVENQILQMLGGNSFKGNLEMETAIYAEAAVEKNNKWTVNTKLESTGKEDIHTVYQLINVDRNFYQIHGEGTITTDKSSTVGQINGMPVKYKIGGTSVSDFKIDKSTGWIKEVNIKQVMSGNVEIMDNPKVPGGLKFPMSFTTDVIASGK